MCIFGHQQEQFYRQFDDLLQEVIKITLVQPYTINYQCMYETRPSMWTTFEIKVYEYK